MKKIKFLRQALVAVLSIALLATGCSKDAAVADTKPYITKSILSVEPHDQQYAIVRGYIFPADAKAEVSLTDLSNGNYFNTSADGNGFFLLEKIPTGKYVVDVTAANPIYQGLQFNLGVSAGNTVELKIRLQLQ